MSSRNRSATFGSLSPVSVLLFTAAASMRIGAMLNRAIANARELDGNGDGVDMWKRTAREKTKRER